MRVREVIILFFIFRNSTVRHRNISRIHDGLLVGAQQFKELFITGILLALFENVKLLFDTERGLTQAEGWNEPRSDLPGGTEQDRGGEQSADDLVGEEAEAEIDSEEVGWAASSSLSSITTSLILALLLRVRSPSGLPDLARLLGSLVLPGGGEEDRFPSNMES